MYDNYYIYEENDYGCYTEDYIGNKTWLGKNCKHYLHGNELLQTLRTALEAEKLEVESMEYDYYNEEQFVEITIAVSPTDFISKAEFIKSGNCKKILRDGFFYEGTTETDGKKEYIRNNDTQAFFNASPEAQERILRVHRSCEYDYLREQEDCMNIFILLHYYKIFTKEFENKAKKIMGIVRSFNHTQTNDLTGYHDNWFYTDYRMKLTQYNTAEETENKN